MRLSSLVSLVVVTASLALGGCAADADQTAGEDTATGEASLVASKRAEVAPAVRIETKDSRLANDHAVSRTGGDQKRIFNSDHTISRTGGDSERMIKLSEHGALDVDGIMHAKLNPAEAALADSPLGVYHPGDMPAVNGNIAHGANNPVIAAGLPGSDFGDVSTADDGPTRSRDDN